MGDNETTFTFNASLCYDREDPVEQLEVAWDWDNDGTWDTNWSTNKTATHEFTEPGTYTVLLGVKDLNGTINTTECTVIVTEVVIPEFTSIVVPMLSVIAVLVIVQLRRRRGK